MAPSLLSRRTKRSRRSPLKDAKSGAKSNYLLEKLRAEATTFVLEDEPRVTQSANFPRLLGGEELPTLAQRRWELYSQQKMWITAQTKRLLLQINAQFLENVVEYVNGAHRAPAYLDDPAYYTRYKFADVPTGVVFCGLNLLDHRLLFDELLVEVKKRGHFTCRISSKDCTQLKSLIVKCVRQAIEGSSHLYDSAASVLLDNSQDFDEPSELEEILRLFKKTKGSVPPFDMRLLECWYRDTKPGGNIVVLFEDFEQMDPRIVSDFILLCSSFSHSLPFVFLFSVSTRMEALHQSLPKHAFSRLEIEKFCLRDHFEAIDQVIETLFVHNEGNIMQLSSAAYTHLLEQFQCHHFSLTRFVNEYMHALLCHFCANPLSILFHGAEQLQREHVARLVCLPSFQNRIGALVQQAKTLHLEGEAAATWELQRLASAFDDAYGAQEAVFVTDVFPGIIASAQRFRKVLQQVFPCVLHLQQILKSAPFRKPVRTLYDAIVGGAWFGSAHFQKITRVIRGMTPLDIAAYLRFCKSSIKSFETDLRIVCLFESALNRIYASDSDSEGKENGVADFVKLDDNGVPTDKADDDLDYYYKMGEKRGLFYGTKASATMQRNSNRSKQALSNDALSFPPFFKWFGIFESNPHLKALELKREKQQLSALEKLLDGVVAKLDIDTYRELVADWCACWFRHRLAAPSEQLVGYEAFYYCTSGITRQAFHPDPPASLMNALKRPHDAYFNATVEQSEKGRALFDASIAFKLLQQSGKMVNLRDWFEAFAQEARASSEARPKRRIAVSKAKASSRDDLLIQARFIQAVRELEFVGFLKPTTRKTDHMLKVFA